MTARPRAPLCDMKPTRPRGGVAGPKVAFIETSGAVLITPMQLGPTSRIPACRQTASRSDWRLVPSPHDSANPEEITTSLLTPLLAHWRAVSTTRIAGTAITARSTGHSIASTVGYATTDCTTGAEGLSG